MKINRRLKQRRSGLKQPLPKKLLPESCTYQIHRAAYCLQTCKNGMCHENKKKKLCKHISIDLLLIVLDTLPYYIES